MADFDRRDFLKSLGALGLATIPDARNLARGPLRTLFPELLPAEEIIPGRPLWYASTCRECPAGCGVLLKVRENNVIKIEGNPAHPISRGGLCLRGQAALQELYHPERLRQPVQQAENQANQPVAWETALAEIHGRWTQGKTVLLSGHLTGSQKTFAENWVAGLPANSSLVIYELSDRNAYLEANKILFDQSALPEFHLEKADLVLSFGADFMETWYAPVALTHAFSQSRRYHEQKSAKFIYVGCADSLTGANADEEYNILPQTEIPVLLALANYLLARNILSGSEKAAWQQTLAPFTLEKAAEVSGLSVGNLKHLGDELLAHPQAVVLAGESLTAHELGAWSQLAVNILNYVAGHYGRTISLKSALPRAAHQDFGQLIKEMETGQVQQLILHQTNPLYTFPDSARLAAAMKKVPLIISLTTCPNDTTSVADLVLPVHHTIETWGIEIPEAGIFSLVQPGMAPVFDSKPFEEILQQIYPVGSLPANAEEFVRQEWEKIFRLNQIPPEWKTVLQQGGFWNAPGATRPPVAVSSVHSRLQSFEIPNAPASPVLVVNLSHRFLDGRGANKPWLWEIPDQIHQTVWETPLRVHPNLAQKLGLKEGEIVSLNQKIEAPVLISAGMHPEVVAIELGGGHANYSETAIQGTGNPLQLLSGKTDTAGDLILFAAGIQIKQTGKWRKIVRLQGGYDQGGRGIIQSISLAEAIAAEKTGVAHHAHAPQIYPEHPHPDYDWTMVVDLSACIGCGACAAACYAENNLRVVGKSACANGREMAWLHIERFEVDGRPRFIPVMCQHCEAAPCETVCPVYATVHSNEGLNLQVYNRCVGTRYCSNNCPYKARRFNYFPVEWPEPTQRQLNPDIYHRPKGVMEKCTFCVQRIRLAKEDAKIAGRRVQDQEVVPACAQSCPAQAITFGNLNDPTSRVAQLVKNFRGYTLFESLNTQPSVIYLKGIKHE